MPSIPYLSIEAPYAIVLVALQLAVIYGPLRPLRRSLMNTLVFFVACLAGDFLSGVLNAVQMPQPAMWLDRLSVFGEGLAVIRYGGLLLFNVLLPRLHVHVAGILADILVIFGYIGWAFIRLNTAGVELSHLVATSAVLTAVLAISMQDTLGNLLGGLALQMDNSLEIGDWIEIDNLSGQVRDIQWRFTALLTRDGRKVVVPNSQLMKGRYAVICDKNASAPALRRHLFFNVDLAVPPARVIQAVEQDILTATIPHVAAMPVPSCVLMDFGAGYARYDLRYWLTNPQLDDPTDSSVRTHILASLQREGIRLATDDHTIHLVEEGEAHRLQVQQRELKRRLDAIRNIELFARLSEAEKLDVAQRLVNAPFASGDIVTRQGAIAHWLYIIISGEAEAWWQPPEGERRLLERRGPGSVFGEIGLMTGAPRRATVVAMTDIEAYRLDKEAFGHIMRARPELADLMSAALARRLEQFAALETRYQEGRVAPMTPATAAIGQRIREFFGL